MARFAVLRIVALALAILSATAGPVRASVITTGDVDPGGAATQPDPWSVGGALKVGDSGDGTLNVDGGGRGYQYLWSHRFPIWLNRRGDGHRHRLDLDQFR